MINQGSEQSIKNSSLQRKFNNIYGCGGGSGSGGGGGATTIFTLKANDEPEPILIAGGGGGSRLEYEIRDTNTKSHRPNHPSYLCLLKMKCTGGSGGSWNGMSNVQTTWGRSLIYGGIGGLGCKIKSRTEGRANGGFGGGGAGGCRLGGGGGGYVGGEVGRNQGNGEGGYSYTSARLTEVYLNPANHYGPGLVLIIRAICGCGCDYRCIALDQYTNITKCLCPQGWLFSNDSKSCIMIDDSIILNERRTYIILLLVVIGLFTIIGICLVSYQQYREQSVPLLCLVFFRRQTTIETAVELSTLDCRALGSFSQQQQLCDRKVSVALTQSADNDY